MAIRQINPRFDPPKRPWWKKMLGLTSLVLGGAALPFTGGTSAAAIGASAGLKGASVATGLGSALTPSKGGKFAKTVPTTSGQDRPTGIQGIAPPGQKPEKASALDTVSTVLGAVKGIGEMADNALRTPAVAQDILREAQQPGFLKPQDLAQLGSADPQFDMQAIMDHLRRAQQKLGGI